MECLADVVRAQLTEMDAVLVWVNPVAEDTVAGRGALDAVLREVAATGILVSAHPDVIDRVGTKEVLFRTREMGWGTETHLYGDRPPRGGSAPVSVAGAHHQQGPLRPEAITEDPPMHDLDPSRSDPPSRHLLEIASKASAHPVAVFRRSLMNRHGARTVAGRISSDSRRQRGLKQGRAMHWSAIGRAE